MPEPLLRGALEGFSRTGVLLRVPSDSALAVHPGGHEERSRGGRGAGSSSPLTRGEAGEWQVLLSPPGCPSWSWSSAAMGRGGVHCKATRNKRKGRLRMQVGNMSLWWPQGEIATHTEVAIQQLFSLLM